MDNPFSFGLGGKDDAVDEATLRHRKSYLNNLGSRSYAQAEQQRQEIIQRRQESTQQLQAEEEKYWATSSDLDQASFWGRTWAKTQNAAAAAVDTVGKRTNQLLGSGLQIASSSTLAVADDKARKIYARYKADPGSLTDEERTHLNGFLSYLEASDNYSQYYRDLTGNENTKENGYFRSDRMNPYFENKRAALTKELNDAVDVKYDRRIQEAMDRGDEAEANRLIASKHLQYTKNASKAALKYNDAFVTDLARMAPDVALGLPGVVATSALQAQDDYMQSRDDYEAREGTAPLNNDGYAMAGMAGLNFAAGIAEGAVPLAAAKILKNTGKVSPYGTARNPVGPPKPDVDMSTFRGPVKPKGALEKFGDSKLAGWGRSAGAGLGGVAAAAGQEFVAEGIQDSVQRGWGSLDFETPDSRSFTEAGTLGAWLGGGINASAQVLANGGQPIAEAIRYSGKAGKEILDKARGKAKAKLDEQQQGFNDFLDEQAYNPAAAIRTQVEAYGAEGATEEAKNLAVNNIKRAVEVAEEGYAKAQAQLDELTKQQDPIIKELQGDLANIEAALKQPGLTEDQIAEIEMDRNTMLSEIEAASKPVVDAKSTLDRHQKYLDEASTAFASFDQAQQATKGETVTPAAAQSAVDTLTQQSTAASAAALKGQAPPEAAPEVQKAADQIRNFPMMQTPENLLKVAQASNTGFTQNEQGLLRRLAEHQIDLNSVKSTNDVSREIIDGGPTFKGLKQYLTEMTDALRNNQTKKQERLIGMLDAFEASMQQKAAVFKQALEEAAVDIAKGKSVYDAQRTVYKDQQNGRWLINRGEVEITSENRAELGAVWANPRTAESVQLGKDLQTDVKRIQESRAIMQQMQEVRGQLATRKATQADSQAVAKPVKEVTPPIQESIDKLKGKSSVPPKPAVPPAPSTPATKPKSNTAAVPVQPSVQQEETSVPSVADRDSELAKDGWTNDAIKSKSGYVRYSKQIDANTTAKRLYRPDGALQEDSITKTYKAGYGVNGELNTIEIKRDASTGKGLDGFLIFEDGTNKPERVRMTSLVDGARTDEQIVQDVIDASDLSPTAPTPADKALQAVEAQAEKLSKAKTKFKPSEFTNYSGGAYGADTLWDVVGNSVGFKNHVHFRPNGSPRVSKQLNARNVRGVELTPEQMETARVEIQNLIGAKFPNTAAGNLQVRNYYQVLNADGVFAIAALKNTRAVEGGTNTAVQLGIQMGKPVHVWDTKSEQWFSYDAGSNAFVEAGTPELTQKFAGVGTRAIESYSVMDRKTQKWVPNSDYLGAEKEAKARQAILDVYEKALKENKTEQLLKVPSESEVASTVAEIREAERRVLEEQAAASEDTGEQANEAADPEIEDDLDTDTPPPENSIPDAAGKLSIFEGLTPELREALRKEQSFTAQNLVQTSFTQKSGKGFKNPLVDLRDFISQALQSENWVGLLQRYVKEDVTHQQAKQFADFVEFYDGFSQDFSDTFEAKKNAAYRYENFASYLTTRKDGKDVFDENTLAAAAASAYTWFAENGTKPAAKAQDIMKAIFHDKNNENDFIPNDLREVFEYSTPMTKMADNLGKRAIKSLGLRVLSENVDPNRQAKLEESVGAYIIYALESQGLLEVDSITNAQMVKYANMLPPYERSQFLSTMIERPKLATMDSNWSADDWAAYNLYAGKGEKHRGNEVYQKFVRLVRDEKGQPPRQVLDIVDSVKGTNDFLNTLFGMERGSKDPLLTKPKPRKKRGVKKSPLDTPSFQNELINNAEQHAYRIRTETTAPILYSMENHYEAFKDMLDLTDGDEYLEENFHITEWKNEQAKRRGTLRELEDARDFIQEKLTLTDGEYNPIYMPMETWQPQRIGLAVGRLNPQRSQAHRTMVTPADYKAEIDVYAKDQIEVADLFEQNGNVTDFGMFLSAVAEHAEELDVERVGLYRETTVDKVDATDFLPQFVDWLNSETTQKGIRAAAYLLQQSQKGEAVDARTYTAMKPVLQQMGMGIQSFHGLIALAEHHIAKTAKQAKFTTYLRAGSDGIASGSGLAAALTGTLDLNAPDNSMSEGFGILTESSVEDKGFTSHFDVKKAGQGDIYNRVVDFLSARWTQMWEPGQTLTRDPVISDSINRVSHSIKQLFGEFVGRSKGKGLGNPVIYGSGDTAINNGASASNLANIYKTMRKIALDYKQNPERAQQNAEALEKDLNNLLQFQREVMVAIPDGPFWEMLPVWASRLVHDYNLSHPDKPLNLYNYRSERELMLALYDGKGQDLRDGQLWWRIRQNYNSNRVPEEYLVDLLPKGSLMAHQLMRTELSKPVEQAIFQVSNYVHGKVNSQALQDAYKDYLEVRNVNIAMSQVAYTVYDEVRNTLIEQALQKGMDDNGRIPFIMKKNEETKQDERIPLEGLSGRELREIDKQLYGARPILASASSVRSQDPINSGIMLASHGKGYTKAPWASVSINANTVRGRENTSLGIMAPMIKDPGVRNAVMPVQSVDAAITTNTIGSFYYAVENMHDNNYSNILKVPEVARFQNKNYHDFIASYHMQVESLNMMRSSLDYIAKGAVELSKESWERITDALKQLNDTYTGERDSPLDVRQLLLGLTKTQYEAEFRKLKHMDSWRIVHQYSGNRGQYTLGKAEAELRDKEREALKLQWNSKARGAARRIGDELNARLKGEVISRKVKPEAEKMTTTERFFENRINKPIAPGQVYEVLRKEFRNNAAYTKLLNELEPLMPEGLTVNYFNTAEVPAHVKDNDKDLDSMIEKEASAWFSPTATQVNIVDLSSPNAKVEPMTVLHELLHAGLSNAIALVNGLVKSVNPKLQAKINDMSAAIGRIEALRTELLEGLHAKNDHGFDEQLANVDEFISYGLTDQTFKQWLAATMVKRNGRKNLSSAFKDLVKGMLDTVLGSNYRAANRAHIHAYEALVWDVGVVMEGAAEIKKSNEFEQAFNREALPMMASRNKARERALNMSSREVFNSLDGSGTSPEFLAGLSVLMDTVVDRIVSRVGREHLQNGLDQFSPDHGADAIAAGFNLSEKEAYAVAALEAALDAGLESGAGSAVLKTMTAVYNEARNQLKVQDFHEGDWNTATAEDRMMAHARYNYVFKPDTSGGRSMMLPRFAALALASEDFARKLDFIADAKPATETGVLSRLGDMVERVLSGLNNLLAGTYKTEKVNLKVEKLAVRMAEIDLKARQKSALSFEALWDRAVSVQKSLSDSSGSILLKIADRPGIKDSKYSLIRTAGKLARLSVNEKVDNIPEALREMRNLYNPNTRYGKLAEALNEFKGANGFMQVMQQLQRGTKEIEKARANTKSAVKETVAQGFSRQLKKDEHTGLAYALLYTGAHVLLGDHSAQSIRDLVGRKVKRDAAIRKLEDEILKHPEGNAMLLHTRQLGWHTQSGNPTTGFTANALSIAQRIVSPDYDGQLREVDPALVTAIDQLATLYGFEYMSGKHRKAALKVMDEELNREGSTNGFLNLLKTHRHLSKDAAETRFKDNPLSMSKGWTPEITNPYIEIRADALAEEKNLAAKGWTKVGVMQQDSSDHITTPRALYMIKDGGNQRRVSGVISMLDTHTKGVAITDGKQGGMTALVKQDMRARIAKLEARDFRTYDPRNDRDTQLFANYDTEGNVINYSYRMNNATRDATLQRKHDVAELMGEYAGVNLDKVESSKQNRKVMEAIQQDYATNFFKDPRSYVQIGPNAQDPGAQELWRLLPHQAKQDMIDLWGKDKPMWVRNDMVNLVFGYKKLAAGNIWNKQVAERNMVEKAYVAVYEAMFKEKAQLRAYQVGRFVDGVVATAKDWIVLRTSEVLLGNIKANAAVLIAAGVNPVTGLKDMLVALKAGRAYDLDRRELLRVEHKLRAGIGSVSELEQRYVQLQDSLARNPLREFIEAGTMPAIVDDIETTEDDYGYRAAIMEKIEAPLEKIPKWLRTTTATVMMQKGTIGHNVMSAATQYSDFMARYALYKHTTTKEGMSHTDAVHDAMETFINYDLPSSPEVQWANDTGLVLFTRFLFRYQRVLYKLMRKNPAAVIAQSVILNALNNPTVMDPSLLFKAPGLVGSGPMVLPSAIAGSTPMNVIF